MNENLDISILYAANQLEQFLKLKHNNRLELKSESGWTLTNQQNSKNASLDAVAATLNQFNLDGNRIHNAEIRAGYDTEGKNMIHHYLLQYITMGVGTNITSLLHGPKSDRRFIPDSYQKVKYSLLHFKNLMVNQRYRDEMDQERGQGSVNGVRLNIEDFVNILKNSTARVNKMLQTNVVAINNSNAINFDEFFGEKVPEWLAREIEQRNIPDLEYHFLNAFAIKVEKDFKLLVVRDFIPTYKADTVLESY